MAGFNFRRKADIEKVIRLVRRRNSLGRPSALPDMLPSITEGYIFETPLGGIAARSGTTVSSAACTPYYIDGTTLTELTDNDGASQTVDVYNVFSAAITGEVYITAKRVFGVLVADAEDCA